MLTENDFRKIVDSGNVDLIYKNGKEYFQNSAYSNILSTHEKFLNSVSRAVSYTHLCFENAIWAYTVGAAIAIKKGCVKAADAAAAIGIGLQAFCIPGSVAENRKVGLGHGNLGAMLLSEDTECFCFLAGHE